MPRVLSLVFVLLVACAPVSQTATQVGRLVQGIQVASYKGSLSDIQTTLIDQAKLLQMGGSYTPLSISLYASDTLTLSSTVLKGSISRNFDAKDFSVEVTFSEQQGITEVKFRPSDADLAKAQEVIKALIGELDKRYSRNPE